MEKIVENCPWRENQIITYWCIGTNKECTGPDCGPFHAAKAVVDLFRTELKEGENK